MPRPRKVRGAKRVTYELIKPDTIIGQPIYAMLRNLVDAHHQELEQAKIALAWCTSWRPDVDGRVTLGKCKKASDLDRELVAFDFIILLRKAFWQDSRVSVEQRVALLDHELCHAAVRVDDRTGDPVTDERGRIVYRMRKHDVEEFADVVRRHGIYKSDLEVFAAALRQATLREGFTSCGECNVDGWRAVMEDGILRTSRCACWKSWAERRKDAAA
jgi:hypothetical protein